MKSRLFVLMALFFLVGCKGAREREQISLVPFASQASGLRGLRPAGWAEMQPGIFVPDEEEPGARALMFVAGPGMTLNHAAGIAARNIGLNEALSSKEDYQTGSFSWELFEAEFDQPEIGLTVVELAIAETAQGISAVALQAPKMDYEALRDELFMPVLDSVRPLVTQARDLLTFDELMSGAPDRDGPVHNDYLLPMESAGPARHVFEGTLRIPEFEMSYQAHNRSTVYEQDTIFPALTVDFFTHADYLVPARRDIVRSSGDRSYWHVLLSPGEVWSEPGDNGMSRASFPFALVGDDFNQAHNGVATFLFDDEQVSELYLQITQETAAWHHTDFWGQRSFTYDAHPIDGRGELVEKFTRELDVQLPIRPWSELESLVEPFLLSGFAGNNDPDDVSAAGLIVDGTIYLQSCYTRYGAYPYCGFMRHGVFSVTKSMAAAVALLRLAEKYGEGVFDLKLADYVEITAGHEGWSDVTFGDALNMATGVGDHIPEAVEPNVMYGDEDEEKFDRFLRADSAEEKFAITFSYANYPWGPGQIVRYNSINTFLLSAAMDAFLKSQEGQQAEIWNMVVEEVYEPIGVLHAPIMRTIESEPVLGLPIFAYGLYPTVNDVALVAGLLQNGGRHEGQQLLHAGKLAEALYRAEFLGFPTGESNQYGEFRYLSSFRGAPYRSASGGFFFVPYMTGFGGNLVVLNPNGTTSFRLSDAHDYDVGPLIRIADEVRPFR